MDYRLVSKRVGYETALTVADKIQEFYGLEGTIYRILTLSNKAVLARKLGYSRSGLYKKIHARNFSIEELAKAFGMIREFKERDFVECKIDRMRRYRAMSLLEFNKMYRRKKKG